MFLRFAPTYLLRLTAMAIVLLAGCGENGQPPVGIDSTVEPGRGQAPTAVSSPPATPIPAVLPVEKGATCTLAGGEVVPEGWSGKDTGSNSCNQCRCLSVGLACTKMACPSASLPATLAPTPIPTDASMFTAQPARDRTPPRPAEFSYSLLVGQPPAGVPRYHRDDWRHWVDEDGDCQNTRAEVLIEESSLPVAFDGCRVVSGQWVGLYTGTVETAASSLDVDHMVPLANAHRSGGWAWDPPRKQAYANDLNDPDHLIAVTAGANRSKGAGGPEDWRPPDKSYWCEYAIDWVRIKEAWGLFVTQAELQGLQEMVRTCPFNVELASIDASALQIQVMAAPTPSTVDRELLYDPAGPDRNCGDFTRWADAQAFYEAAGGPGSDPHRLDRNEDGVVCESLPGAP